MPDASLPLDDLTQHIAQRQSELERLRREYEARQARLADLARRREELQGLLGQVEDDIQAVTRGAVAATGTTAAAAVPAPAAAGAAAPRPTLADALVAVARDAGGPLTVKEFAEQLGRRQFPTASRDLTHLVKNRLGELVKRGVFRRAAGQAGLVLAAPAAGQPARGAPAPKGAGPAAAPKAKPAKEAARAAPPVQSPGQPPLTAPKAKPAKEAARAAPPARRPGQPPLRSVLTQLLQKARKPLAARELAKQVLATGYQTESKNFTDVVWTALGHLEGVENVKGQGWRLKRG
jgi:hypothetical protein